MNALSMLKKPTLAEKKASDRAELEYLQKFEDEHFRLQRQVRCIQADRLSRETGVYPKFRSLDRSLRTLNKEYLNLIKDLKIAKSGAHKKNDKKIRMELQSALLLRAKIGQDCNAGSSHMEELDGLIKQNTKHVINLRKVATDTVGQFEKRKSMSETKLAWMENKLEQAMLRFNQVQLENRQLREEIEHLLLDRALFNKNWNKMITALNKGKKFLQDLFESTNLAYDQRDEWCIKLKSVQEKAKLDQQVQVHEMRDLQQALDNTMKLYEFLARKGVVRVNTTQGQRESIRKMEAEEKLRNDIEYHNHLLEEIYEFTKTDDPIEIVAEFQKKECHNFSLYKLLTEYCAANEVLTRELQRVKRDIGKFRNYSIGAYVILRDIKPEFSGLSSTPGAGHPLRSRPLSKDLGGRLWGRPMSSSGLPAAETTTTLNSAGDRHDFNENSKYKMDMNIDDLKDQMAEQNMKNNYLRNRIDSHTYLLDETMKKITGIFNILGCSLEPFQSLLGDKYPTLWTMNLTFSLITEKIEDMIHTVYYFERGSMKRKEKAKDKSKASGRIQDILSPKSRLKKYTIYAEPPEYWTPIPIQEMVAADPCSNCVEARMLSQVTELREEPFTRALAVSAINKMQEDPAFVFSDRVHPLTECRLPRSRAVLARRYN